MAFSATSREAFIGNLAGLLPGAIIGGLFGGNRRKKKKADKAARAKAAYDQRAAFIKGDSGNTLARYNSYDPNAPEGLQGVAPTAREVMPDFQVDPRLTGPAREAAIQQKRTEWMAGLAARDKEQQMRDLLSGQNQIIGDTEQTFGRYIDPQLQELEDNRIRQSAQAMRAGRGFGGSVQQNFVRGANSDYVRSRNALTQQNMMNRLNVMNSLKGKRLDLIGGFNPGGPGWQTPLNLGLQAAGTQYSMQQDKINQDIQRDANNKQFWASIIGGGVQAAGTAMGKPPGV